MASSRKKSTSERQTLILWALLARENAAAFQKDLRPEPTKADRDALETAGLVRSERRGRSNWLEVTDQGWEWAGSHLASPLPHNSPAGCAILQSWLEKLQTFLVARKLALADVLDPLPVSTRPIRDRIREAYLAATKGRLNTRALLRDIRPRLSDVDHKTLDEALKGMQRDDEATLFQLDNRAEVTEADRDAAIYFAGEPRHILWIEK